MNLSSERRGALTAKARDYAGNVEVALPYLLSRGISLDVAQMFQLGSVPAGGEHGSRLSIPYVTPAGVVHIKYRCTDLGHDGHKDTNCHKYLYEAGLGVHLYNAQCLITAGDTVVLTEGELDAICIQAYVGYPSVAYPGVGTWGKQDHWPLCFEGVPEVIVVADGDKIGKETAREVAATLGTKARVVDMPAGHDANSFLVEHGAAGFRERLTQ